MIIKRYLYDLEQWEVVILAERAKDDHHIGLYDSEAEADTVVRATINLEP
jgi:hypothetical protein